MSKHRAASFRQQMRQSMNDLKSIMEHGQSPSGDGTYTVRTVEVIEPGRHDAHSIRRTRRALKLSQTLFARLLGVSPALVRAWELGTREPAPLARRLLDQIKQNSAVFAPLLRVSGRIDPFNPLPKTISRKRRVA